MYRLRRRPPTLGSAIWSCAHHEKHVGLARRKPGEARSEAAHVALPSISALHLKRLVFGCHVLHVAARSYEGILEDRVFPGPANGLIEAAGQKRYKHEAHHQDP